MKGVLLQPSYIPWRGYFHRIQKADVFVFYDDVEYDKRGWRNRNRVKTAQVPLWLTIPVRAKGCPIEKTPIHQIQIASDEPWARKHWQTLLRAYGKSPYFKTYADELQAIYSRSWEWLADFTIHLTLAAARWLGIQHTRFVRSSSLDVGGVKTDRLVATLNQLGVTHYISGPSAKDNLEEEKLAAAGITLEYLVYDYPEYPQLYPPFDPQVSILDLLFMTGPQAATYIWDIPSRTAPH